MTRSTTSHRRTSTAATAAGERRDPRGLTLIETLIALTVLVALAAIVVPPVLGWYEEQQFETAGVIAVEHLRLARAHAREARRPVEVVYDPERAVLAARLLPLWPDDADTDLLVAEPWAQTVLPGGVTLSDTAPADDDAIPSMTPPTEAGAPMGETTEPFTIVAFLPDGSTLFRRDAWLADDAGRNARLTVTRFTGIATIERGPDPDDDDTPDEDDTDDDVPRSRVGEAVTPETPATPGDAAP